MVFGIAVDLFTVGGDDFQSKHALACRPDHGAVPAVSALQKIATEANAFAMAGRKEQPLCVQFCCEDAGDLARADVCDHPIRFDSAVIEAADVEQQATVAQVTGRPAVPARTYADVMSVGLRITDRCDHVVGVVRLHDYIGKTVRQKAIPYRSPTRRFVTACATEEGLFGGKQNHCTPLFFARAVSACIAKETPLSNVRRCCRRATRSVGVQPSGARTDGSIRSR